MSTFIIVSDPAEKRNTPSGIRVFRSSYEAAAHGYRSRTGWERSFRSVVSRSADAVVAGRDRPIALYSFDQTRPFTARRSAQQRYLDIFFAHARKDEYGLWHDNHWITVTDDGLGKSWQSDRLTAEKVLRHANHGDMLALKSDGKTQFIVVDLDCHKKDDVDLFLRRAERLLQRFHGDGWHYQLRDGTITGLHFIKVFEWPWRLEKARQWVADHLRDMDEPGLDLTKLEIYPTSSGNGIRLPLAKGYLLILDEIVEPVTYRKRQVGDVERYVNWLDDENRQYFPKDRLLSFLRMNVPDRLDSSLIDGSILLVCKKEQPAKPEGHGLGPMKGCFWSKLTDYWSGRWTPPGALDEAIAMTARVGYKTGYTEAEIVAIIKTYCRSLPHAASGRLDNPRELNRCIIKQVRGVKDNKKQQDSQASDRILNEVIVKWRAKGLDLLNQATWDYKKSVGRYDFQNFDTKVAAEDLQVGKAYLVTAFPNKCQVVAKQSIERIMLAMATLTQIKHQEENGISAEYWQDFFRDQFHLELCVRNIWDVLKAAMEIGVIAKHCGWHRGRSTMYTVGQRMVKYLAPSLIHGSITLVCKKEQLRDDWEQVLDETVIPIDEQLLVVV